tara:strand:- start:221 stop:535 length:315 start_codon:yes stop_codon:yes gene_type:complete
MEEKKEQLKLTKSRWKLLRQRIGKNIIDSIQKINPRSEDVEKKFKTLFSMSEGEQIEEILKEANAYNLRQEVKTRAKEILQKNNVFFEIDAYVRAYYEIIEEHE